MARNINERLQQLHNRRSGIDRIGRLTEDAKLTVFSNSLIEENWQKRARTQPYTRYALGSMQEVDSDYTRISIESAQRVGNQLNTALANIDFRLQGSVPLNVHIRGVSDVDVLVLNTDFLSYATSGQWGQQRLYTDSPRKSTDVLLESRQKTEDILKAKFPAAKIDTSGGKAINISGGSLARPVDVVPSHWYDTVGYQASGFEHDRGVIILNKKVPEAIINLPFLHIKYISDRCNSVAGGLRKAIRLCKNVKAEAEENGDNISLPSFDIAATMYHADLGALLIGCIHELAILAETQRHLDALACNHTYAKTLLVPDGSRAIFNTADKLVGLNKLSTEMDNLLREVAKEQNRKLATVVEPSLLDSRSAISSVKV